MVYNRFFIQAVYLIGILLLSGCGDEAPLQNLSSNVNEKANKFSIVLLFIFYDLLFMYDEKSLIYGS